MASLGELDGVGVRRRSRSPSLADESTDDSDDLNDNATSAPVAQTAVQEIVVIDSDDDTSMQIASASVTPHQRHPADPSSSVKRRRIDGLSIRSAAPKRSARKAIVGRKPKRKTKNHIREIDSDEYDEHALLDDTLPSYLTTRRKSFKDRCERLREHGLMLPPSYDEVYFSGDERLNRLAERPQFTHIQPVNQREDIEMRLSAGTIPAPIAQWLRPYQIKGAEFLHEAFVYQRGVVLGDDMGLGKTIQVIAFLTAAFGKTGDERDAKRMRKIRRQDESTWYPRVLIIAPGGLMSNWQSELQRWGWWSVYQYHGSAAVKSDALSAARTGRLEVMITTYGTYLTEADMINSIEWDCVIADECHQLKNHKAKITQAMNDVNALCRIGLTGTAIQNKYEELWTILNWTSPGRLGALAQWKMVISEPLRAGQSHSATVAQLAHARKTAEKLVNNLLPQFFLRRMKSLIADQLPKKSDKVIFCPLTPKQSEAYNNFCSSELVECIKDRQSYGEEKWQTFVFPAVMTLQKLSNHLALMVPSSDSELEKHDRELDILKLAVPFQWQELYAGRDSIAVWANQNFCGKWAVLKKMLRLWYDNGDKVLVFSHSVRLLRMLNILFRSTTSYNISYLDGSMSYEERQNVVDEYNSSPSQFVFLISTKAGGVGLNITSANKVVVVDPNWNPAWDLQAQDRAYRIGQTRDVDVFRLVSAGTIEENVYARQIYKQQQANIGYNASAERRYFKGVQNAQNGEIFGLDNLLAMESENIALRDIVNQTNIAESKAGYTIADLDLEACDDSDMDDDFESIDSERAMSQLAASIIDEPGTRRQKAKQKIKSKDAIQAVLDSAGVKYTHENAQVIGSSKVEMQISSRAKKAGENVDWNRERAFAQDDQSSGVLVGTSHPVEQDGQTSRPPVYQYRPPEDVRRRQFCSMAAFMGFEDVSEFALVVEGWTQLERRRFLDSFYRRRREVLAARS